MSIFDEVEISALPAPQVIEEPDFELILRDGLTALRVEWPEFDALVLSEPTIKIAEMAAYLAVNLRARVNDGARAVMLPYATGADLDNLAAFYSIARDVVDEGDPDAIPPRPRVMEDDGRFRRRVQLAPEAMSNAGTRGSYTFHALSAAPSVADAYASPHDPTDGDVTIAVLADDWEPDAALLNAVNAVVQHDDVRCLCDRVLVVAADITDVTVTAEITWLPGVAAEAAAAEQSRRIEALRARRQLGRDMTRSEIIAALHVPGVHSVDLTAPAADVEIGPKEAARITSLTLTDGGVDE